ncbi:MAG TPA: hypothetical protein VF708_19960 [Pyrinomonadaceae bacterium]|jgi:hypothetical protein
MDPIQILQAARITGKVQALQDVRTLSPILTMLSRTPIVPAEEGELMVSFIGNPVIADLVADDQKAAVYSVGKFRTETHGAPNLKLGQMLTQAQIKLLRSLNVNPARFSAYDNTENTILDQLLNGVRMRMEAICWARAMDGFSYRRLGIIMDNVTWGMPQELKVTLEVPITDHANCLIVTYINNLRRIAQVRYGIVYDRISMSLAAFNEMIACAEFQAKARTYLAPNVSWVNLNTQNTEDMSALARRVLSVAEIELQDWRYWTQGEDGVLKSEPFMPINKFVFSARMNDNNAMVADFANGVPTEVDVSNLVRESNGIIGSLPADTYGPVGYAEGSLNPPQITYWGVARGWSRKHLKQETAVMTVAPASGDDAIEEVVSIAEPEF